MAVMFPASERVVDEPAEILLYSSRAAAKALGISVRKLTQMTAKGDIPCVRIGWRVLYDPADLRGWITSNKTHTIAAPRRDRSSEKKSA